MDRTGGSPELIVLVDERGTPIGSADKASSHHADTPLHLAFSCYVFDGRGRFLTTRRSSEKAVWPGVWTNSVCGHPAPGESLVAAIERRLREELGMVARDFEVVLPHYRYRSPPFRGVVENEFCPVVLARAAGEPRPDGREVDAFEWVPWDAFVRAASADTGDVYSWWCKDQLPHLVGKEPVEALCGARAGRGPGPLGRGSRGAALNRHLRVRLAGRASERGPSIDP